MIRTAIFAHFDGQDEVKPYVVHYLGELARTCARIVFVSTSKLGPAELSKVRPTCDETIIRDNVGYDFGMWQAALADPALAAVSDEIVLTNSSLFGPIHPLGPIIDRMSREPCHFWGMTDNLEYRWHLQSYFLVFKKPVLESQAFRRFWDSVLPYRNKGQVILSYEVGLTSFLVDQGFRAQAWVPTSSWAGKLQRLRMDLARRHNPTLFYPEKLLERGMPFVKATLLRENVGGARLGAIYRFMENAGYDRDLVSFDRPVTAPDHRLRTKARRVWFRFASEGQPPSVPQTTPIS
jgi:lipopolysaccharide biosynthesis protein